MFPLRHLEHVQVGAKLSPTPDDISTSIIIRSTKRCLDFVMKVSLSERYLGNHEKQGKARILSPPGSDSRATKKRLKKPTTTTLPFSFSNSSLAPPGPRVVRLPVSRAPLGTILDRVLLSLLFRTQKAASGILGNPSNNHCRFCFGA